MTDFLDILKKAREKTGLSQESFAKKVGMQRPNYVGVETGRKFLTEEQIESISKLTGVPFDELYDAHERWELSQKPEQAEKLIKKIQYLPIDDLILLQRKLSELVKEHDKE